MLRRYSSHSVVAIIPVYKEVGKVGKVLSKFSSNIVDEIFIIIDEPSRTIRNEVYSSVKNIDVPFHIYENKNRKGIGYAIKIGIKYAIDNNFDIIVVLAGNNKDDPVEIHKFLNAIIYDDYDYVQGSRFLPGGIHKRTPLLRSIFIRLFPLIWSILTKTQCTDVTNGFRAYSTNIFKDERINIWQEWINGYGLEYYLHYKVLTLGYRTREVPVKKVYPSNNNGGYSKIIPYRDWWQIVGPLFYLKLGIRK